MLITTENEKMKKFQEELESLEYGYSVMSEPTNNGDTDSEGYKEALNDWGWSGDPKSAPEWYSETAFEIDENE